MRTLHSVLILFVISSSTAWTEGSLFDDLALVEKIDKEISDKLPLFYNHSMMGGYYSMPSARMDRMGVAAAGAAAASPYSVYGILFQPFSRLELSLNYRVYNGCLEGNFGREGFGDDADRIGNIKLGILLPEDGLAKLPTIAIGADDFLGSKRFNSQYIIATKEWTDADLEASFGWGRGRIDGFFGGITWSPLRKSDLPFLQGLSVLAEYDANNYEHHQHEHPKARKVKSRINVGINYLRNEKLQLSVCSLRGCKIAAAASLRYPIGTTKGIFPKIDNPASYIAPVDTEPLGETRPEKEFAQELAFALADQGLDLYTVFLTYTKTKEKKLWIKVVNNRYRKESEVKSRLYHILSALTPSNVDLVSVVMEETGIPTHSYEFRTQDLFRYRKRKISSEELKVLSPMLEAIAPPEYYDRDLLFQRKKRIWTFTFRPRLLSYFGGAKGKFKYDLGLIAAPEGYLGGSEIYYRVQVGYSIKSSLSDLSATDRLNPSKLPNVRTDTICYLKSNTLSLEQAYLQKGWNLGKGFFTRLAGGYFEIAYGGFAAEALYYPVHSNWAIGIEGATVWKRRYHGLSFTGSIREVKGDKPVYVPFVGAQGFLDLYYKFNPLKLDFKVMAGRFLARDLGARFEVVRCFPSGLRFGLWYTVTNGHDRVNGHTYYDKGFFFALPLDIFLRQSSRSFIGYAMSAWLRDVGAVAETGKRLYPIINEERWCQ